PADTDVHRATWLALSPEERRSPVLAAEHALSRRHPEGWAATMVRNACWDARNNRHVCPDEADYINPGSHRVVVELTGIEDRSVACTWLTAPRGGASARGMAVTQPCGEPARFDAPYPMGLQLTVEVGGREVARADITVRDILVVGVGDSFGSGEGNPDVPVRFSRERAADYGKANKSGDLAGYPARVGPWKQIGDKAFIEGNAHWLDQACHRSLYSFELRTALQLALEDPHRAVTYIGLACAGAEVTWGLFLRYKGNEWVPRPPELSQVSAIAEAQCGKHEAPLQDLPEAYHMQGVISELQGGLVLRKCPIEVARKIDLVMVSIGGNDIGFARLVANAVLSDGSLLRKLGGWFGQVHGNQESGALLDRLDERYKALNRALHGILYLPWEESDRIILAAYPPLALLDEGGTVCPDGNGGMEVAGELSLSEKAALSSSWLAGKLHEVMAASAMTHGWSFVEAHRKAFVGRGLCAGFTDNAFSIADDLRLPRKKDGRWVPYNPADFQAYAPRQRWFRTPNDAFMTGNFHVAGSVLQKALKLQTLSWFQLLLASTYSGAFHPTAEGHAAIADAVAERARAVLAKYGQSSDLAAGPR
ncbi:MAG TPA: hypothetical protein VJ045_07860, partial [Hyphomicrobiaceae bacterium]|nr:hypothetical protein [Hyphomicrobiaceae bacterium]